VSTTIDQYQSERQNYYESLSTFETFGRGWTRRVNEVTEKAKEWIA
jgi:lysozyme family protein